MSEPWGFIAHKDGYWGGAVSATAPSKELGEFLSEFVKDGYAIQTVYSREEYLEETSKYISISEKRK